MEKHYFSKNQLSIGVCYYPEHWEESLWESDLKRMRENGIEVVRIAEFAWNFFEPEEGCFTFVFFDKFMDLVQRSGMKVIFCTPTATPPAWASERYPEILNADKNGVLYRHGSRRHYNYNSPKYRELTEAIVTRLAEHYGKHDSIIGWQIDNEFNCELNEFYSESDSSAFRVFLQKKYSTLEKLNQAWGTVFWNQGYSDWGQVYVPRHVPRNSNNPHMMLDYYRFISDSVCNYTKLQSDILRKYIGDRFITTNGIFSNFDYLRATRESLDFVTYDSYPNFAYCMDANPKNSDDLNDRKWSRNLSEVRAISPSFGIMEQQSGANGWNTRMEAPAPKPGQLTLWTLQSIAHGADFVSYFRWRTCNKGTEIYWHGILDYSNKNNRKLSEVCDAAAKVRSINKAAGSKYKASFAVLKDYDNIWDAQLDRWHERVEKVSEKGWFKASQLTHIPMDYLYLDAHTTLDALLQYPLLVYPHATILTEEIAALLEAYLQKGGMLLMGCRTGYKDKTGQCPMRELPGLAAELCGVTVDDFTFVGPIDDPVNIIWDGEPVEADLFNDILEVNGENSEVLGEYDGNYYKGKPGLVCKKIGQGMAYYFGAAFTQNAAITFLRKLGITSPFTQWLDAPNECELALREGNNCSYLFVLNFAHTCVQIDLKVPLTDLYTGKKDVGTVALAPFETKVYMIEETKGNSMV